MTIAFLIVLGMIFIVGWVFIWREAKAEADAFVTLMHKVLDRMLEKWEKSRG